jgi:hypothetical protein
MAGQTTKPFVLKDVSLTMRPAGTTGTSQEFRCQLSQAQLTPSTSSGSGTALETFCDTFPLDSGSSTWTLDLAGFQALADVTDFSVISFNSEGEEFEFLLNPMGGTISASNPGFKGNVTMVATPIGGTANTHAVFTASLPCVSKPTMITAPVTP